VGHAQEVEFLTVSEIEQGLDAVVHSPSDDGRVELIVRRPLVDGREVLEEGELDTAHGLVGDTWSGRASTRMGNGGPHPDMQLNVMNARFIALIAGSPERRPLAGDQLYLDLDLSEANLPAGTRLEVGSAVIEVTDQPHTGCVKFAARFGPDALRFVNSPTGRSLRLRGLNAKVVIPGTVRVGDAVRKTT
jgi:hypothetical protein